MNTIEQRDKSLSFMNEICKNFTSCKKAFIIVSHIVPTSLNLINVLNKVGRIAGIIAKPNSVDRLTYVRMKLKNVILPLDKLSLKEKNVIHTKIEPLIKSDEKLFIIDIGGYFAGALKELNAVHNLAGIVEDTENGLQKYEKELALNPDNKIPIYSVARSRTKDFEDYLVGRAVAQSTLKVLEENTFLVNDKNFGIIGFGEVGRGAAFYLKNKIKKQINIYDWSLSAQNLIVKSGFNLMDKQQLLKTSDVIIGATGNKSINDQELKLLKSGSFVSSCTSHDDEFDFFNLDACEKKEIGFILIIMLI